MKRALLPSTAALGLLMGCLAAVPPELIDARLAFDRANNSQTRVLAPGELAVASARSTAPNPSTSATPGP